ncbi:MAG: hypothetical protein ACOCYE_01020, partial [Pseudomonadota bacterium]
MVFRKGVDQTTFCMELGEVIKNLKFLGHRVPAPSTLFSSDRFVFFEQQIREEKQNALKEFVGETALHQVSINVTMDYLANNFLNCETGEKALGQICSVQQINELIHLILETIRSIPKSYKILLNFAKASPNGILQSAEKISLGTRYDFLQE